MGEKCELITLLKPDFTFFDDRGAIFQLIHEGYSQVNAVFTKKGCVRGNFHFHEKNEETFFVAEGAVEVEACFEEKREKRIFKKGDMFTVHKLVRHSFSYLEDTWIIGLYDKGVDLPEGRDILTD